MISVFPASFAFREIEDFAGYVYASPEHTEKARPKAGLFKSRKVMSGSERGVSSGLLLLSIYFGLVGINERMSPSVNSEYPLGKLQSNRLSSSSTL